MPIRSDFKSPLTVGALVAVCLAALTCASAQEVKEPAPAPAAAPAAAPATAPAIAPAAAPSSAWNLRSLVDRAMTQIGTAAKAAQSPAAQSPTEALAEPTAAAPTTPPPVAQPAASGSLFSGFSLDFNPVDIEKWSKDGNTVLDQQCKTLVQPFGIADNTASLMYLAAKTTVLGLQENTATNAQARKKQVVDVLRMAARNLNWLPMTLEKELGARLLEDNDILEEDKNADTRRSYAQARQMLADIVQDLPQPMPYEFQVKLRSTSYGNASALPGGIILVDRDLFKKGADLEFAYFVMAHEVAHVLQRHQTRVYQGRLTDGIESVDGLRKLMRMQPQLDPAFVLSSASALKRLFVNFTEQQELQADSCAMRLLSRRYPDANAMQPFLQRMEERLGPVVPEEPPGPQGNQPLDHLKYLGDGVLERHPNTAARSKNLNVYLSVGFKRN